MNPEPKNLRNIFLIGYRCTGKSSVGRFLAAKLGWPFIDTDELLVSDNGSSIKEIVEKHGWETFRRIEHVVVKKVCALDERVVATGGGIVVDPSNVELMRNSGKIVWLKARPETIKSRMALDEGTEAFRPSLTAKDSFSEIEQILLERNPMYRQAMDFCVKTDNRGVDEVCDIILQKFS